MHIDQIHLPRIIAEAKTGNLSARLRMATAVSRSHQLMLANKRSSVEQRAYASRLLKAFEDVTRLGAKRCVYCGEALPEQLRQPYCSDFTHELLPNNQENCWKGLAEKAKVVPKWEGDAFKRFLIGGLRWIAEVKDFREFPLEGLATATIPSDPFVRYALFDPGKKFSVTLYSQLLKLHTTKHLQFAAALLHIAEFSSRWLPIFRMLLDIFAVAQVDPLPVIWHSSTNFLHAVSYYAQGAYPVYFHEYEKSISDPEPPPISPSEILGPCVVQEIDDTKTKRL